MVLVNPKVAQEALKAAGRRKELVSKLLQQGDPKATPTKKSVPLTPDRPDGIKRLHHKLTPASASTKTPSTATPDAKNPKTEPEDAKKQLFGD